MGATIVWRANSAKGVKAGKLQTAAPFIKNLQRNDFQPMRARSIAQPPYRYLTAKENSTIPFFIITYVIYVKP